MGNSIKEHDLFATRLLNPDKGLSYFIAEEGLSSQNTQLKDKEFYQNAPKVKELFTDENGVFKQKEFDDFYSQISLEHSYLNQVDSAKFIFDTYEKSAADFITPFGKVKKHEMEVSRVTNPLEQTYNIVGFDDWSTPTMSAREAAQKNRVKTGQNSWTSETLNDIGLGIISMPGIVYATYDSDGYHVDPFTGKQVAHHKGQFKTDEFGKYYTEIADSSENLNKQFVTLSEVFTDDDNWTNYLDPFDSDNREQSIFRTSVRAAATIAATFIPYVGPTIIYGTAALEFAKALPGLAKMVNGLANDHTSASLNSWDNYMKKFSISRTDEAQEQGFWAIENVINMVQDSFMQLTQQRAIAQLPDKIFGVEKKAKALEKTMEAQAKMMSALTGAELNAALKTTKEFHDITKLYEKTRKLSDVVSKVYLTTTAMQDTFNTARQNGLDQETSAWVTLLSLAGMYTLLQTDYFKGMLSNTPDYELSKEMSQVGKAWATHITNEVKGAGIAKEIAEEAVAGNKLPWYKTLAAKAQNFFNNHTQEVISGKYGIVSGMIAEGVEELSEELMQDTATQLARGLQMVKAGLSGKTYEDQYKWLNTNPLARYSASFFGGAIGGAIFKTSDLLYFDRQGYKQWVKMLNSKQDLGNKIVDYVAEGKAHELIKIFEELENSPIASKDISAITGQATSNPNESINHVVFNNIKNSILTMDAFIRSKGVGVSKTDLENIEFFKNFRTGLLKQEGVVEMVHNEYLKNMKDLLSLHSDKVTKENSLKDATDVNKEALQIEINGLDKLIDKKTEEIKSLISGSSEQYMGMTMLKVNPAILNGLLPTDVNTISQNKFHVNYDQLPKYLQLEVDKVVTNMKAGIFSDINLGKAWSVYRDVTSDKELQKKLSSVESLLGSYSSQKTKNEYLMNLVLEAVFNQSGELTSKELQILAKIYDSGEYRSFGEDINPDNIGNWLENPDIDTPGSVSPIIEKLNSEEVQNRLAAIKNVLVAAEAKLRKDQNVYNKKESELTEDEKNEIVYLRAFGSSKDFDLAVKNLTTAASKNYFIDDVVKVYDASALHETLNHIFSKFGIDPEFNIFESVNAQLANREVLMHNYRLSPEIKEQFEKIKALVHIAKSIINGSDKNLKNNYKHVIVGANNELNSLFKDKGIDQKLSQVSTNGASELISTLDTLLNDIDSLETSDRENSGKIVSRDKTASIERAKIKLKALQYLFADGDFLAQFDAQLPPLDFSTEESDEEKLATELRQRILDFEKWFSKFYLEQRDPEDVLNFIVNKLSGGNPINLHADPGKLNNDNFIFEISDQFWYLLSLCSEDAIKISVAYKNKITSDEYTKCPFDMQEEVAVQAARLAVVSKKTRLAWVNALGIDANNGFAHNIIKVFGLAGVGKSDAIIPMISEFTGKKIIISVNTEIQQSDMKARFGDAVDVYLHQEILEKDSTFFEANEGALFIFDESTNIPRDRIARVYDSDKNLINSDARTLDAIFEDNNIVGLFLGDPTQTGETASINNIVAPSTLQMYEPVRSQYDILRQNLQMLRNQFVESGGYESLKKPSSEDKLIYYQNDETGEFVGHKYVELNSVDDKVAYVENFVNTFGKGKSVMVFSKNPEVNSKLAKLSVDVFSEVSKVQGSEWDYVICLEDLSFTKDDYDKAKDANTILSRARYGTILPPLKKYWKFDNVVSQFPPIEIGLTEEIISEFKRFKTNVLNNLNYGNIPSGGSSTGGGQTGSGTQPPIIKPVPVVLPVPKDSQNGIISEGRATTDWILVEEDNPTLYGYSNKDDYYADRYSLYVALTENDLKKIPSKLAGGKFVFSVKTGLTVNSFAKFGNTGELGKWISKNAKYTFLAYVYTDSGGNEKIMHLGLVYTEHAFTPFDFKPTEMTMALNIEGHGREVGLYEIPPQGIRFARGRNPLDIHKDFMNSGEHKIDSQSSSSCGMSMPLSPTFFMSGMPLEHDLTTQMSASLRRLSNIRKLYEDIYTKLSGILGTTDLSVWQNYVPLFTYTRTGDVISGTQARNVPTLNHSYCSFVCTEPGHSLEELFNTYVAQLVDLETTLQNIKSELDNPSRNLDTVQNLASSLGHKMETVSIISWDAEVCESENDVNRALEKIFNDENGTTSYISSIYQQIIEILTRCKLISEDGQFAQQEDPRYKFKPEHKNIIKAFVEQNRALFEKFGAFITSWIREDNNETNEDWITKMDEFKDVIQSIYTSKIQIGNESFTIAEMISWTDAWAYNKKSRASSRSNDPYLSTPITRVYPKLLKYNFQTFVPNRVGNPGQNTRLPTSKVIAPAAIRIIGDSERIVWKKYGQPNTPSIQPVTPVVPGPTTIPTPTSNDVDIFEWLENTGGDLAQLFLEQLPSDIEFSAQFKQVVQKIVSEQPEINSSLWSFLTDPYEVGILTNLEDRIKDICTPF